MTAMSDLVALQSRMSLEMRLTDPTMGFGLRSASPLQRAICRIADGSGLAELANHKDVVDALGGVTCPAFRPKELAILACIRGGKSLFAAALALHWSQTVDVAMCGPGEVPRIPIVSTTKDNADVVFGHIVGRTMESPVLRGLVIGDPTAGSIVVRHPSGRPIQIKVSAGSRAGSSLVSRWVPGVIFDEFPRMVGGEEHVVNWDDQRAAVLERIMPGGQIIHIGSPWQPEGPAYEMVQDCWGKPTKALVVVRAAGPAMNPAWWTPERIEEAKKNPDTYRTECLGEFATAEEAFFAVDQVQRSLRPEEDYNPALTYVATMDPATRGNGWTLGVFTRQGPRKRMVLGREWIGSRNDPLSPKEVMGEIANICRRYKVFVIDTDQYYVDALQDMAREYGISLSQVSLSHQEKTERYMGIRAKMALGEIELVDAVRGDMIRLRKKVTPQGVQIVLPLSPDGRHCDYAPVVMMGLGRWIRDEAPPPPKKIEKEVAQMFASAKRKYGRPPRDGMGFID